MICLASFNPQQMEKMQRDAVNRVNEMHRRASQMVNPSPSAPPPPPPPQPHHNEPPHKKTTTAPVDNGFVSSLSKLVDFKIDEEKALIGLIIYILAKNKADPKLLIGLGYLLL